ncbi:DUF883 family protein [Methylotetracoccus oryzae]|uniref:DUF883 family protein n=1 Tax=Methylotetracoccus oryzae TaxID=1919059 RepID=UPI0011193681|nr:DUF883 family protein [Methylotetracoccus oryzae]
MGTTEKVSKFAHEAGDKIADAADHAAEVIGEKGKQIKSAEQRLMKQCRGYVCGHPVASIGIAGAAGFLLGWMLSRR